MALAIKGFLETSFIDWDGKIAAVVFLPHCNFHCPFCHNFGLITNPQNFETVSEERVLQHLLDYHDFLDGLCITGGEPCLHKAQGLSEFMNKVKKSGFLVKLDTNGSDPDCLQSLIKQRLVDYVALDVKGPLDERYYKLAGKEVDLEKIKQSVNILKESNIPHEFRTTIVPTLLAENDLLDLAGQLAGGENWFWQQFVAKNSWVEALRTVKPYTADELKNLLVKVKEIIPQVKIRGS
ncbi:anaerobic ribonucleoside-triphosphate reductase activating protein [Candidatus Saganbacteria bacterium]|nr:anaerobic ribonucleoside-triphosphate reductase activating protein [Candidatus Saganbacteria bacterium]